MPFFHPPILLPLVSFVSDENYSRSFYRWQFTLLVMLAACGFPVFQLTNDSVKTIALLTTVPVLFTLLNGQDSVFVLLGLLLFALGLKKERDTLAGIALSLTVLRPTLAIALGTPLLFVNRRAFISFCVSSAALTLYSLALVGPSGFRALAQSLVQHGQVDPTTRPDRMYSVVGLLTWLKLSPLWAWVLFALSIPTISVVWRRHGLTLSTFGAGIVIATFTSPHLHIHDLVFLTIPLTEWPTLAVIGSSVLFMLTGLSQPLAYLLMIAHALVSRSRQPKPTVKIVDHGGAIRAQLGTTNVHSCQIPIKKVIIERT